MAVEVDRADVVEVVGVGRLLLFHLLEEDEHLLDVGAFELHVGGHLLVAEVVG